MNEPSAFPLQARDLVLGYDARPIVDGCDFDLPRGQISTIIGANGCGKSTLLRGLARLLTPASGTVLLDGEDIHGLPTGRVARKLGILPQSASAPEGMTVAELVGRGRTPHRPWFTPLSAQDLDVVASALESTDLAHLSDQAIETLSGGQRQRAWIAMALAQQTGILLLDEPTTYLDLAHQVEVMDLLVELNRAKSVTIGLVLHDLNLACRYSDALFGMRAGAVVVQGPPREIVSPAMVRSIFGLDCIVIEDPVAGTPLVIPRSRYGADRVSRAAG